jgi:O-antigen ligase
MPTYPLIHKEIAIAEGNASTDGALNGRMTRWEKYFEAWEQMPTINHFIGVPSSNHPWVDIMIGGGMHSDYVRLLFLTGIIGLSFYILFLLSIAINYFRFELPEKFLTLGMVVSILLWSVSTIPTMYAPVLYMVFSIFAYSVLPNNKIYR